MKIRIIKTEKRIRGMKILDAYSDEVWEQRRYEIAKDAMVGIIANSHDDDYRVVESGCSRNYKYKLARAEIVRRAVLYADALIAELKKKGE